MVKSTITSKGQVTIPKKIRESAMLHEGSSVDFQLQTDGKILIIPIQRHISQLRGILKSKKRKAVTLAEMKKAIYEGAEDSME